MAKATSERVCVERHERYPYDVWRDSMDAVQRERLSTMFAAVHSGDRVLDVGCNSGYAVEFVPPGCEVWGIDVSEELIAKARARLAGAEVARAESLPFGNDTFDVVVLGEILEHVFDPILVLREAARVAHRSVIGSTPTEDGAWGAHRVATHEFHVRCYTEDTLFDDLFNIARDTQLVRIKRTPHIYIFEVLL